MCVCSVCKKECVREFWAFNLERNNCPKFETADGKQYDKYLIVCRDDFIICGNCDWKLSQLLLENKSSWFEFAHEFTPHQIMMWGLTNQSYDLCEKARRLKRNETARLNREKKKEEKKHAVITGGKPILKAE